MPPTKVGVYGLIQTLQKVDPDKGRAALAALAEAGGDERALTRLRDGVQADLRRLCDCAAACGQEGPCAAYCGCR